MAASVKYLGAAIPAGQTIFLRGLISLVVLTGVAFFSEGIGVLKTRNWRAHGARSLSGTISMFCWFTALVLIPLADMTAISFATPMFLTLLAIAFLGERIRVYRWTALCIGLVGVIIMIGPLLSFSQGSSLGVFIALGAAFFGAFAQMSLRGMSDKEHAITITFYFSLTSMLFAALTSFSGWPMPTPKQWLIMILVGLFGVSGQLMLSYAYRYAEASTVAPLDYTSLLMATVYGVVLFNETPSTSIWLGAPLVIVAGLIILWREYRSPERIAGRLSRKRA